MSIECKTCGDTRRVKRYIGHPGRCAIFVCFDCPTPASRDEAKSRAAAGENSADAMDQEAARIRGGDPIPGKTLWLKD